ncbi:MAG: hypothetical protein AAGC46_15285, partial [Solirubrobacteraceae bacterium]
MKPLRSYLALAATAALIFLGLWALLALARFGSCASGGVYVSARECAPGTGLKIVELMVSIFGTLILGGMAVAFGGSRAAWAIIGLIGGMLASYFLVTALGPDLAAAGTTSDAAPALIAGAVCAAISLPFLWQAVRPAGRGAADTGVVI